MMFNVPQYVDVEDKVAGPLTAKQLMWMLGMGACLMVLWNMFPQNIFYILSIPTVCLFVAFAFYRPHNMPLVNFVGHSLFFLFRPKVYMWNRPGALISETKASESKTFEKTPEKTPSPEQIAELARVLNRPLR